MPKQATASQSVITSSTVRMLGEIPPPGFLLYSPVYTQDCFPLLNTAPHFTGKTLVKSTLCWKCPGTAVALDELPGCPCLCLPWHHPSPALDYRFYKRVRFLIGRNHMSCQLPGRQEIGPGQGRIHLDLLNSNSSWAPTLSVFFFRQALPRTFSPGSRRKDPYVHALGHLQYWFEESFFRHFPVYTKGQMREAPSPGAPHRVQTLIL